MGKLHAVHVDLEQVRYAAAAVPADEDVGGRAMEHSPRRTRRVIVAFCARAACQSIVAILPVCAAPASSLGQSPAEWRWPPSHEQLLPGSVDDWEPALAVGPSGEVLVVAGRRKRTPNSEGFEQKLVLWRSDDGGATFQGPWPVDEDAQGNHWDQRVAVDAKGIIYISYMEIGDDRNLRLARSRDGGRSFSVETATDRVSDKPELAISTDGSHVYIVYELVPDGPSLVASNDGGATWNEPRPVVPSDGRHFWPEALALAPDGILWFAGPAMSLADLGQGNETSVLLHVFRSSDAARSWQDTEFGSSLSGGCVHEPPCRAKGPRIDVAVANQRHVYVVYTEGAASEPYGLFLKSSSDGGRTWSEPQTVSAAPRPKSGDAADHYEAMVAASRDGRVCVVWADDRRGMLDFWARCSGDRALTWGPEFLLSDRSEGASYKSADGFKAFYGHYGDVAIDVNGRLHVVWGAGEPGYRTGPGGVWVNSVDLSRALGR